MPIRRVFADGPSRYWCHAAQQRLPERRSQRAFRDEMLVADIQRVWHANWQIYGADMVWLPLKRECIRVARCTVDRLMCSFGL